MFFNLFSFSFCSKKHVNKNYTLRMLYIRPKNNHFEVYNPSQLPLCISNLEQKTKDEEKFFKSTKDVMDIDEKLFFQEKSICTTNLSTYQINLLKNYFVRNYEMCFDVNYSYGCTPLFSDDCFIYTRYAFKLHKNQKGRIRIQKIDPGNPLNFTDQTSFNISFLFEQIPEFIPLTFSQKERNFYAIVICVLIIFFVMLIKPSFTSRPINAVVSTVPQHSYILVMLCGAGCGVVTFLVALGLVLWFKQDALNSWWLIFAFPAASSSLVNSIVTTILCIVWRLKDVASAHYFAPLLVPAITLFIIFSVEWIPVCVGTCLSFPLKAIFYFIIAVIFVKLPVNLAASLMMGAIININNFHHLSSIPVRRIINSRRIFMVVSNCLVFIIIFPFSQLLEKFLDYGIANIEWKAVLLFVPIWLFACICIGLNSLSLGDAEDWAMFAFLGSGGSGLVYWIVRYVMDLFSFGTSGTLQMSLQTALSAMGSLVLTLAGGSISVLAALTWILIQGSPAKSA